MESSKINIGILTSSRADFGIYLPLLKALDIDSNYNLEIIAFGTHCDRRFGNTVSEIEAEGFSSIHKLDSTIQDDTPAGISRSYAETALQFAEFWEKHTNFDLICCLGDRFEMAAAVTAGIPFGVRFAHIHGGETTLGAIDNIYRHQITLASEIHFTSLPEFEQRVKNLLGRDRNELIATTGALSLDNLSTIEFLSTDSFYEKWKIDLNIPSILITVHPETVDYNNNKAFCQEVINALNTLIKDFQLIITLPNADTGGLVFRESFKNLGEQFPERIKIIENFGTQSYFTCMKHVKIMLGNTSSGIIEAASFKTFVVNVGDRQKGRPSGANVHQVPFNATKIVETVLTLKEKEYSGNNPYFRGGSASTIVNALTQTLRATNNDVSETSN